MITVTIDDRKIEVEPATSVLEAATRAGIDIPTLCYHKDLSPYGACRLCLVEVVDGGRKGVQASCQCVATDGLVVRTDTERVIRARTMMLALLRARFPESEEIRALAERWGGNDIRIPVSASVNCMLCGLCVRACAEVSQRHAINFVGRGTARKVSTPFDEVSETCIGCGACAYLCPVKAITIEEA